jgi:steroid delta-isomerase-like uncharacterized protein
MLEDQRSNRMSAEHNKATVRRFLEEYTPTVVDDLLVSDYVHHDPAFPPEMQRGRDSYKQINSIFLAAFPDLAVSVDDILAEGDEVAARWTWSGTHQGEMMGLPPTGKRVSATGTSFHRLASGQIAESWINFDALGMMQQLGAIPAPGQPGL